MIPERWQIQHVAFIDANFVDVRLLIIRIFGKVRAQRINWHPFNGNRFITFYMRGKNKWIKREIYNRLNSWQHEWFMCTVEQWLYMKNSIIIRFEYRWLINFSWHKMNINRWNKNKVLIARNDRVEILVGILMHRCDCTRVAHPKVYCIGLLVECSLAEIENFWVKVLHELGKVVGEIWVLSLDVADGSTAEDEKMYR